MRDNKITSSGPISSKNYLKKNVISQWKPGHSMIEDYIEYGVAKKACIKANTEGKIELLTEIRELFWQHFSTKEYRLSADGINLNIVEILNKLEDKLNANKQ